MNSKLIYFDYNATTPLDPSVRTEMLPFLDEIFGNPSSIHQIGRRARAILDDSRDRVAAVWKCRPSEVVFTSGGTESNNLAVFGVLRKLGKEGGHFVTTRVEHPAVLHAASYWNQGSQYSTTLVDVDTSGRVDPQAVIDAIRPETILVSVQAANNEVGTLQPVAEIGRWCRDRRILFHTDAVQWFGKLPFADIHQFEADLVSCCAHKFHGPKGAGALFVRSPLLPDPLQFGGSQENERRPGTENLAGIVGFTKALELFIKSPVFASESLVAATIALEHALAELGDLRVRLWSPKVQRLPNTVAFTVEGTDSIALLAALDLEQICASSGSACAAGSVEPSHVIRAMGGSSQEAKALVRFSLGRENTPAQASLVASRLRPILGRVLDAKRSI